MAVTEKNVLEKDKIKSEIREKEDIVLLKKIDTLRFLLNDYCLTTSDNKGEPSYTPVISLQDNRMVIEEIIMKLIKKVRDI